jgi:hypothetical protein
MERNPYQPPESPVSDNNEGPLVKPTAVTAAIFILFFGLAVDVAFWLSRYGEVQSGSVSGAQWTGQLIGFAFAIFLYLMIGRGKNWARIVLLVFTIIGFGLIAFVYQELMRAPLLLRMAGFGRPLCNAIAIYLVFIPGSEWFKPR